jgi:hypothetical protein
VGVRGSEGVVRECVGHWDMRPCSRNAPTRMWGRVPTLGSPPSPCHLNQVDPTLVKLAQGLQSTGDMRKTCSKHVPQFS